MDDKDWICLKNLIMKLKKIIEIGVLSIYWGSICEDI